MSDGDPASESPAVPARAADDAPLPAEGKPVIAMIHVGALPGTPANSESVAEIVERARAEARLYADAGVRCLMIENMNDVPYTRGHVGPEIVAAMTLIAEAVKRETELPLGIQILAGADLEALAVAHATGLDFVRVECFAFAHVADEGLMQSNAAKLLRYRRAIGAQEVQVWADIKKKHSAHAITADVTIAAMAEAVEFMGADAVIVTGPSTGRAPMTREVRETRSAVKLPVFVGSGVTLDNVGEFLGICDGVIVGSALKHSGHWRMGPNPERVKRLVQRAQSALAVESQATLADSGEPAP